jgi:hypothetical protein
MGPKLLTGGIKLAANNREMRRCPLEFPGTTGSAIPFMRQHPVIAMRRDVWAGSIFLVRKALSI